MPFVSRVYVERLAHLPFSVAHEYAEDFFHAAERSGVEVRVPLRDLIPAFPGHVRRPVRLLFALHPDETEGGRLHDAMLVEWTGGTRLFPHFHGTLRLRIASVDTTLLSLEGAYRPPMGVLGRVFDALIGRRVATATLRDLLERLATAVEHREAAFRTSLTSSGITV